MYRSRCCCSIACLLLTPFIGCGQRYVATQSAESSSADAELNDSITPQSSATLLAKIEIPDGTPDELFAYIASLDEQELSSDAAEQSEMIRERMAKRVKACNAILAQNPAPEAETSAVQLKLDALRTLSIVDPDGIGADFQTYATSLVNGNDPYLARLAMAKQFQHTVNNYISQGTVETSTILEELNTLVANKEAGPRVFMEARDAIGWLVPNDEDQLDTDQLTSRMALVAKCYRAIGNGFSNYVDSQVADEAKGLLALADQFDLELLRARARTGEAAAVNQLYEKLELMFAAEKKHGNELGFAIQTAQGLEFDGLLKPALRIYELAWKNVESDHDANLRSHVQRTHERATTRLGLVGQPMEISGTANGTAFDWTSYSGKHVLVCFWESWVVGWHDEIKNIQASVAEHANKPIEIVTVNLDSPELLKEYLDKHQLDITVVSVADSSRSGTECSTAIRYGVDMLPFCVLVGPDGNVQRIHVFGAHLIEALQQLSPASL
ncbi:MAG: TlpA family protein disulfide reductase [Planctomycetales bacterium]|nr:TlpA family protein disulfide reductase [Planctomycetales bacterium]